VSVPASWHAQALCFVAQGILPGGFPNNKRTGKNACATELAQSAIPDKLHLPLTIPNAMHR